MKNPVNLTTTKKGLTTYLKDTPCKRNWLRTNAMTYYIIMQLLNIKENWSPLAFRQKDKWLFKGNKRFPSTSAVSQEITAAKPIPLSASNRPIQASCSVWSLVPQWVSEGQMGLNLRQRRTSSESRSCCVTGCPALTNGFVSPGIYLLCKDSSVTHLETAFRGNILGQEPKVSNTMGKAWVQPWDKHVSVRASGPTQEWGWRNLPSIHESTRQADTGQRFTHEAGDNPRQKEAQGPILF